MCRGLIWWPRPLTHSRTSSSAVTDVTFSISNTGSTDAGVFRTEIVWSPNNIVGDADDVLIDSATQVFAGLAAGQSETRTVTVTLDKSQLFAYSVMAAPAGLSVGTVAADVSRLFLVIDAANDVPENVESNNSGVGHLIDSDDISYFPWDTDNDGTITPLEALAAIQSIGTANDASDFDGNGVVTPLEALSIIQRIGYVRNDGIAEGTPPSSGVSAAATEPPIQQIQTVPGVEARALMAETGSDAATAGEFRDIGDVAVSAAGSVLRQTVVRSSATALPVMSAAAVPVRFPVGPGRIDPVHADQAFPAAAVTSTAPVRSIFAPANELETAERSEQLAAVLQAVQYEHSSVDDAYSEELDWLGIL
ncbi:MAG: CARDB domain-containing protein [Planctomycetaceae bacterium]